MVAFSGKDKGKDYNSAPVISGSKKIWFLNGDLVRVYHNSRANGTITLYNINKDQNEICFITEFKKKRERAFTVNETAQLLNRHRKYMPRLMKDGIIPTSFCAFLKTPSSFHSRNVNVHSCCTLLR